MRARQVPWITPGTGKTHLACALAVAACAAGKSVYFTTLDDMVRKLRAADAASDLGRQLRGYLRTAILVIDEAGYLPLNRNDANLVFQIVARRYEKGSIIITSNKAFSKAHMFAATCARRRLKRDMFGNMGAEGRRWRGGVSAGGDRGTSGAVSAGAARRLSGSGFPAVALFLLPPWEALVCPVLSFP
jgi:hypothetical protein